LKTESALIGSSRGIPLECGEPVFREPWQAQAFAMTVRLYERGLFTWTEWAQALSTEIAREGELSEPSEYYRLWLSALEKLISAKSLVAPGELAKRQAEWRDAAAATPHGEPIVLGARD
jgi:nitrile hydratase accessory protein